MNRSRIIRILIGAIILSGVIGCKVHIPEPEVEISIPGIDNFSIDGNPEEWSQVKSHRLWADPLGNFPDTSDLKAYLKVSWNKNSLLLLLEVSDESFISDTVSPWNGDAIEVFLSPFRGSENILQVSIIPLKEENFVRINEQGKNGSTGIFSGDIKSVSQINGNKRTTEIDIGFLRNEDRLRPAGSLSLQVYVDDTDTGSLDKNQLVWYPVGQSYNCSSSMYSINLCEDKQSLLRGTSRLVITDNEKLNLYVFGATNGDKIGIYRNGAFLANFRSTNKSANQPDSIDITSLGWDIENDSLFVTLNRESLCFHELFLVPRLYEKLEEKRFDREIRNFISRDRLLFPPENATLFIGSSSIVRWETLKKDFPELEIIQRGFGGSTSPEALIYINQIALPYKPAKIVYYEGDNDIVMGFTSEEIRDNVMAFVEQITAFLPETKVYILSPKPSINRMNCWGKYKETHILLRDLADEYDNVEYVDVATPMFDQSGKLNYSLFVDDGIHMNEEGYAIWTRVLRKALELDK